MSLTEDNPTIKPYEEADWGLLPDGKSAPVELSLSLLEALDARWVFALKAMSPDQLDRTFIIREINALIRLKRILVFIPGMGGISLLILLL